MRQKRISQLSFFHVMPKTEIGKELKAMSDILDEAPQILDGVFEDLVGEKRTDTGRTGMTAEQTLRCALLKQYRNLSYEELAFHLDDSTHFRGFARLKWNQHPSVSTLQENIQAMGEDAWESVNRVIVGYAARENIEKGRTVRIDSTAVESDVHYPTDSALLQDGIGLITRLLIEGKSLSPVPAYSFSDHRRVVKRRVLKIHNTRKDEVRLRCYKDLLDIAARVRGYALEAILLLDKFAGGDPTQIIRARILAEKLERAIGLLGKVMDQTKRRVIDGEKVPASEKLVSIFECHTDIIEKGQRETVYGHKLFLVGGKSGLILDCVIERGNPADSTMFMPLIDRQKEIYNRVPLQSSADRGFASLDNVTKGKQAGIRDVSFSKRKGISILDMVKSSWVYRKLNNFRAGIEANISVLKRAFGLSRCTWTGWDGFVRYVRSAIAAYNLLILARLKSAAA